MFDFKIRSKQNKITPRQLRAQIGSLTTIDVTDTQLIKAAERQWKRFNDDQFKHEEFENRYKKVFESNNK